VLSDGRRYRCPGSEFGRSTPTPSLLAHAKRCVALSRLVVPAALRAVFAAIAATRTCLSTKGLRVTGGPVFPPDKQNTGSPNGELVAGAPGAGGAFVAFYGNAQQAQRLEPDVARNARRFGGQVERRGAVTIVWIRPPARSVRLAVQTCAFR
jgi:hypothetical protein